MVGERELAQDLLQEALTKTYVASRPVRRTGRSSPLEGRVYVVEYRDRDFDRACRRWGPRLSIVRRDIDVTPGGVNRRC